MNTTRTYTVIGLLDLDKEPTPFLVAAVVEGEIDAQDSEANSGEHGQFQRYSATVEATSADHAEELAIAEVSTLD